MENKLTPIVSVIVPVYNVEKYVHCCIDSILTQTFNDFELILVDDGSMDNCGAICDVYAAEDSRIRVIHKQNGGVAAARNSGLDQAKGEYIAFCDSDDAWEPLFLERMVQCAQEETADIVISNFHAFDEHGVTVYTTQHLTGSVKTVTQAEKWEYITGRILAGKHGWEVWARIFRADVIQKNHIRFCTNCENYAEDMGFVLECALYAERYCSIPEANYRYLLRGGSMMDRSKGAVKLNSLNAVSAYFGKIFFQITKDPAYTKLFPVIHFQILYTEYQKLIGKEGYNTLGTECQKIQDRDWYCRQTKGIFSCRGYIKSVHGKRFMQQILLLSHYCLHGNWKRFRYESAIAYRWIIKEK